MLRACWSGVPLLSLVSDRSPRSDPVPLRVLSVPTLLGWTIQNMVVVVSVMMVRVIRVICDPPTLSTCASSG